MLSITKIDRPPSRRDLLGSLTTPGSALLEGWSDDACWRIFLPWPREVRELSWARAYEWKTFLDTLTTSADNDSDVLAGCPFLGGWIGFLCYDTTALGEAALLPRTLPPEPAAYFARHDAGLVIAPDGKTFLFGAEQRSLRDIPRRASASRPRVPLRDSLSEGAYAKAVEAIRNAIRDGDVYQVNLTRSFTADARIEAADLYAALTGDDPPRTSAFLRGDGWSIASASPEVLLTFDSKSGVAESRPIKGTVRRGGDDATEIDALRASAKDAAEHLMIVDLVRNDLGKVAPPGCVSVPAYRTLRTLEHVHHLESTVRAEGLKDSSLSDILEALSPAGSITGAPKRAAVAKIAALEPVARGIYTGSIGYIDASGRSEFSVAIRTAVVTDDSVRYHAGGGIVWDSDADAEDAETRAKSVAFLRYFGEDV